MRGRKVAERPLYSKKCSRCRVEGVMIELERVSGFNPAITYMSHLSLKGGLRTKNLHLESILHHSGLCYSIYSFSLPYLCPILCLVILFLFDLKSP
jgi:hypothetical protein